MPQEQSPDTRLRTTTDTLQKEIGMSDEKGKALLDEWAKRTLDGKPLTQYEVEHHLMMLEQNMNQITYGPALERTMYHAVLERMRLKMQLQKNPDAKDTETLKDLDRRITYNEYLQSSIENVVSTVNRYERYRQHFGLDAGASSLPRDTALEAKVMTQMGDLQKLLPLRTLLWKIRFFEDKKDAVMTQQLIAQLPDAQKYNTPEKRNDLAATTEKDIRAAVNMNIKRPDGVEVALADAMYLKMVDEHFQKTLQREKDLTGKGDPKSEEEKKRIRTEREEILGEFLGYNFVSLERRAQLVSLLTRSGHIGQPYEGVPVDGAPKKNYGKWKAPEELVQERDKSIQSIRTYSSEFRANVLNREDKTFKIPGFNFEIPFDPAAHIEHMMTTGVIPLKMRLAVPLAQGATMPWSVFDAQLQLLNKNWGGIRDARTRAILEPLYEKLGLPNNYIDLPEDQQKQAMENALKDKNGRMTSTLQILEDFKKNQLHTLDALDQDLNQIESLIKIKDPSTFVLNAEPVMPTVPLDFNALKTASDEERAGAYLYLMKQLTVTHPQELAQAQLQFMGKLNTNMNLQIDMGDVEKQLGRAWLTEWPLAALALLGEATGAYLLVRKGVPWALRKTPAAVRGTYQVAKWTTGKAIEGGSKVAQVIRGAPKVAPSAAPSVGGGSGAAIEKAAEGTSKLKVLGRILGHIGFIVGEGAAIYEISEKIQEIRKSEHVGDRELAHTALEFWKGKKIPGVPGGMSLEDGRAQAYKEELAVLEKSAFVEDMRFVTGQMTLPEPPTLPGNGDLKPLQTDIPALTNRRTELLQRQQSLLQTLAQEKDVLHIELPYLDNIFVRSLDEQKPGYRVNISGEAPGIKIYGGPIDNATRAGPGNRQRHRDLVNDDRAPQRYADQFKTSSMDETYWKEQAAKLKERKSTDQLQNEFRALATDMEQYIRDVVTVEERVKGIPGAKLHSETRSIQTSDVLGNTIDNPVDVSETSNQMQIISGGKPVFLRVPDVNWQWAVAGRDGSIDPKNVLAVNATAEHAGKLSFTGTGRLAFWRKGEATTRFVVDVR